MRNVEIKARLNSPEDLISRIKQLTDSDCTVMKQHDIFFNTQEGKLKLRKFEDGSGELLFYMRPDTLGPKQCDYTKAELDANACTNVKNILNITLGYLGDVKKTRKLYMIGQTRVHIDEVEGLGNFMELEVVLTDQQSIETGENIAKDLMAKLKIDQADLVAVAYIDLMTKFAV